MPPARTRPARKAASTRPYDRESTAGHSDVKPDPEQLEAAEYKPTVLEDELDDEDLKPDVDDSDDDVKPRKGRRKRGKAGKATAAAGTGLKWTADEDWKLFQAIFPRAAKIDWASVSAGVGRDPKVSPVQREGGREGPSSGARRVLASTRPNVPRAEIFGQPCKSPSVFFFCSLLPPTASCCFG